MEVNFWKVSRFSIDLRSVNYQLAYVQSIFNWLIFSQFSIDLCSVNFQLAYGQSVSGKSVNFLKFSQFSEGHSIETGTQSNGNIWWQLFKKEI